MPIVLRSKKPATIALDQYRALKAHILFWQNQQPKTLVITSAAPRAGTSATVANLAALLAYSGLDVLAIDACFKYPKLHRIFQVPNTEGLTTYLTQPYKSESFIQKSPSWPVHILPSGPLPAYAAELLAPSAMRKLFDTLKREYAIILIDAPNILEAADTMVLSALVDGVLLVIPSGRHPRQVEMKALAQLKHARAQVIGTVLTHVTP